MISSYDLASGDAVLSPTPKDALRQDPGVLNGRNWSVVASPATFLILCDLLREDAQLVSLLKESLLIVSTGNGWGIQETEVWWQERAPVDKNQ